MPNTNLPKTDHPKSIFSHYVYRTNNQQRGRTTMGFKSSSQSTGLEKKDPEVLYFNEKILKRKSKNKPSKECSTQTSKTILQLAKMENGVQEFFDLNRNINEIRNRNFLLTHNSARNECQHCQNKAKQEAQIIYVSPRPQNSVEVQSQYIHNVEQKIDTSFCPHCQRMAPNRLEVQNLYIPNLNKGSPNQIQGDQINLVYQNARTIQPEIGQMSPDSLGGSPRINYSMVNCLSDYTLDGSCTEQDCIFNHSKEPPPILDNTLTQTFLEKTRSRINQPIPAQDNKEPKSKSFTNGTYDHPNYIQKPVKARPGQFSRAKVNRRSSRSLNLPDNSFVRQRSSSLCYYPQNTFMCPTAASQIKSKMAEIQSVSLLIPPVRRGRSTSPKPSADKRRFECSRKIPYIDQSKSDVSSSTTLVNANRHPELVRLKDMDKDKSETSIKFSEDVLSLLTNVPDSATSVDNSILVALNKLKDDDWKICLRGLADIVELARAHDIDMIYDYMPSINQKIIELLKSPRSHVCRTACQACGHLFEYVKDTRRPEFDDIVDILLHKTADSNKFIRQDANLALDCMVTHVSIFHAVRALCARGPSHKNHLVRCATIRLMVCAIVIAGPDFVLNPNNNEYTRKRIILNMARFLEDRNLEARKLAERLYKVLCKDSRFDVYLKKYLEKDQITKIKRTLRLIHKK